MGKSTDLDLMLHADGELDAAEAKAVARELEGSAEARAKVEALRQIGEVVRTHIELKTDEAEESVPGFGRLWDNIERSIRSESESAAPAEVVELASERRPAAAQAGAWERFRAWFAGSWQGNVVTGAVVAAAVATVMWATGDGERVVERTTVRQPVPAQALPAVALDSQPPEVENLEVYGGSGTILTIPGEDADDSSTAVIWIDDESDVEGPI